MQNPYANDNPCYTQPPHFRIPYAPHFFPVPLRSKTKPTISFCPAYSKGFCKNGDVCPLNHLDVSKIPCKHDHDLRNKCKFGDSCLFKHHTPKPDNTNSNLSPVVQHIVQENISLLERLTAAEEKTRLLESICSM